MSGRVSKARRSQALAQAEALAVERADTFSLQRRTRKGELLTGFKLHEATTERRKQNLLDKGARPVLKTSEWDAIYEEVGLRT